MGVKKRRDITAQPCTLLLVACPPALLNDRAELLQLALRAQERTELKCSILVVCTQSILANATYPLLRQLPRLLVLESMANNASAARVRARETKLRTLEFLNSSITRRSYGEKPATSRTIERTNLVRADWTPFRWLGRTVFGMAVVG